MSQAKVDQIQSLVNQLAQLRKEQPNVSTSKHLQKVFGGDSSDQIVDALLGMQHQVAKLNQDVKRLKSDGDQIGSKTKKSLIDFDEVEQVRQSILKIQASFRMKKTQRTMVETMEKDKQKLRERKSRMSPEESAIKEFAAQLNGKRLTPEEFFRICDLNYNQKVSVSVFKDKMKEWGFVMEKGQQSRLLLVLDEDVERNITLQEYYDAIHAYGVATDQSTKISDNLYVPFENKVLGKFVKTLNSRNISFDDLFRSCDTDNSGQISSQELQKMLCALNDDFHIKEIFYLKNFLDIDKSGEINENEFLMQCQRAEKVYKQSLSAQSFKKASRTIANDQDYQPEFEVEETDSGDEAFAPIEFLKNKFGGGKKSKPTSDAKAAQPSPVSKLDKDTKTIKRVVSQMEAEGTDINTFLADLKKATKGTQYLTLGAFLKHFQSNYPTISRANQNVLIQNSQDPDVENQIDFQKFQQLILQFHKSASPTAEQTISQITLGILSQSKQKNHPEKAIEDFMILQKAKNRSAVTQSEFVNMFHNKVVTLSQTDYLQAFEQLPSYNSQTKTVKLRDISETLKTYVPQPNASHVKQQQVNKLAQVIPGFSTDSPRSQSASAVKYVVNELSKKKLTASNVYSMAAGRSGKVSATDLQSTFEKLLPHVDPQAFKYAFQQFGKQQKNIPQEDFLLIFASVDQPISARGTPAKKSGKAQKSATSRNDMANTVKSDDRFCLIRAIDNELLNKGISPVKAFKNADLNQNGVLTRDELQKSFQSLLPDHKISGLELKKALMTFDTDRNGRINEKEFIAVFQQSRSAPAQEQEADFEREEKPKPRARAPVKPGFAQDIETDEKEADQESEPSGGQVEAQIDKVDSLVNLKKLFAQMPINPEGQIMMHTLSRQLKTFKSSQGKSLKPSEYAIIISTLDGDKNGQVPVNDVLKFLNTYCSSNSESCELELKWLAWQIETKYNTRNTVQLLEKMTRMKSGQPIEEALALTDLQQSFGLSYEGAQLVLVSAKEHAEYPPEVTVIDLANYIDQYRQVSVPPKKNPHKEVKPQKETKKKSEPKNKVQITKADVKKEANKNVKKVVVSDPEESEEQGDDPFGNQQDKTSTLVSKIEQITKKKIEKLIEDLLEYKEVDKNEIISLVKSQPKCKPYLVQLLKQLKTQGDDVQMGELVRKIMEVKGKFDYEQSLGVLAKLVDDDVEKDIRGRIFDIDPETGIFKQQFVEAFENEDEGLNIWVLNCLFYTLDTEDGQDEYIQLDALIKKLSSKKGPIKAKKPAGKKSEPKKSSIKSQKTKNQDKPKQQDSLQISKNETQNFEIDDNEGDETLPISKRVSTRLMKKKSTSVWAGKLTRESVLDTWKSIHDLKKKYMNRKLVNNLMQRLNKMVKVFGSVDDTMEHFAIEMDRHIDRSVDLNASQSTERVNQSKLLAAMFDSITEVEFDAEESAVLSYILIEKDYLNILDIDLEFFCVLLGEAGFDKEEERTELIDQCIERLTMYAQIYEFYLEYIKDFPNDDDIFDTIIWTRIRFYKIYKQFKKNVNKNKLNLVKAQFNEASREGQLSYYSFANLATNVKGFAIDAEPWLYSDWEAFLDRDGHAYIKFNNLQDFLRLYEDDISKLNLSAASAMNTSMVSQYTNKNVDYIDYELTEDDYYRGCKSILNSEKAALKKVYLIVEQLTSKGKTVFKDKDFGPKKDSDEEGNSHSLYFNGQAPKGYQNPDGIRWMGPEDYAKGQEVKFLLDDASSNEVKQGRIGNCWFIGALSVIATKDHLLRGGLPGVNVRKDMILDKGIILALSKGVYAPIFHKYRKWGIFVLRFYKDHGWRYVIVDNRLPCYISNEQPVFGTCKQQNELWVPLIEKAYAKLFGCYQTLISGFLDDGLNDMTSLVCEKLTLHNKQGLFQDPIYNDKDKFWEYLVKRKFDQCLMGCSVSGPTEKTIKIDGENTGIFSGHAYSLIDVFEVDTKKHDDPNKKSRILRLRNPWGQSEWKGKWSDTSEEVQQYKKEIQEYIDTLEDDEKFKIGDEDGTFLINYSSWRDIFNKLFIAIDFPDHWWAVYFEGKWTPERSGGIPLKSTPENKKRYAKSPQYILELRDSDEKDVELFLSLSQPDGRKKRDDKDPEYGTFPFADRLNCICVAIFKLEANEDSLPEYRRPVKQSILKVHNEVSIRVHLQPGNKYAIVCSTKMPKQTGDFRLSLYFNAELRDVDLHCFTDPLNKYKIIPVEYEKNNSKIAEWKRQFVKESLPYMINENDFSLSKKEIVQEHRKNVKINIEDEDEDQAYSDNQDGDDDGCDEVLE